MSGPGELRKLEWNEKLQKFELTHIIRTDASVSAPTIVLRDSGIRIGCMNISKEAWEQLGERYRKFLLLGHEEIVQ